MSSHPRGHGGAGRNQGRKREDLYFPDDDAWRTLWAEARAQSRSVEKLVAKLRAAGIAGSYGEGKIGKYLSGWPKAGRLPLMWENKEPVATLQTKCRELQDQATRRARPNDDDAEMPPPAKRTRRECEEDLLSSYRALKEAQISYDNPTQERRSSSYDEGLLGGLGLAEDDFMAHWRKLQEAKDAEQDEEPAAKDPPARGAPHVRGSDVQPAGGPAGKPCLRGKKRVGHQPWAKLVTADARAFAMPTNDAGHGYRYKTM